MPVELVRDGTERASLKVRCGDTRCESLCHRLDALPRRSRYSFNLGTGTFRPVESAVKSFAAAGSTRTTGSVLIAHDADKLER